MRKLTLKVWQNVILLAVAAAVMAGAGRAVATGLNFNKFVVFGDSLTDVGNLSHADGGLLPGALTNYTTGMFTDGAATTPSTTIVGNYAYQLNNALGFTPLLPSATGGTDYAYGGSVTGQTLTYSGITVPGINTQVSTYVGSGPTNPADNLYLLWGGGNDILNAAEATGAAASSIDLAATNAANNMFDNIKTLYQNGARDFIWLNLPNLALTPEGRGLATAADLAPAVDDFNSSFNQYVAQLVSGSYPGLKLDSVDINSLFNNLITNPTSYGLSNISAEAQGQQGANPDTYLFWDGIHPTTAADQLLVGQTEPGIMATFGGSPAPEPSSWLLLLMGVGLWRLMPRVIPSRR